MTRDNHDAAGLPRHNTDQTVQNSLAALRDTPHERVIRAAHPFGTNWVRRDPRTDQWRVATLMPALTGATAWNERRIYRKRLTTLLAESEFSIRGHADYPEV